MGAIVAGHTTAWPLVELPQLHGEPVQFQVTNCDALADGAPVAPGVGSIVLVAKVVAVGVGVLAVLPFRI